MYMHAAEIRSETGIRSKSIAFKYISCTCDSFHPSSYFQDTSRLAYSRDSLVDRKSLSDSEQTKAQRAILTRYLRYSGVSFIVNPENTLD